MTSEENIKNSLIKKFSFMENTLSIKRPRRMSAVVSMQDFIPVFDYAVNELGFVILCTITGLDEGARIGLIYHIGRKDGIVLNLKTDVAKENPVINTITNYFPAADIYEREIMDLLGARFEGLAEGKRYPLPDDWPVNEFPLRKDWKAGK
jgi:Ni,Fe-hydrogenase III component G